MADNTRKTSNLVNTIPLSYDDSTVSEQPARPIRGDLWFTTTTRTVKAKQEEQKPQRKPLKRITNSQPRINKLRNK